MSSTLGKTATPNTSTHGWISQTNEQVGLAQTTTQAGLYTSVSFWASGSTTLKIHGVIWDASGNVLAFGPGVNTSGGSAGGTGATQWYTDTFATPLFIPAGTIIYIGWQLDVNATAYWAYNGNDHNPDALVHASTTGSTGKTFTSVSTESPSGAVAVYTTYTPAQARRWKSGAWASGAINRQKAGAWSSATPYREKVGTGWNPGS